MRKGTQNQDLNLYDCVVVGGGPGGLVSALYLGRFRRKVLLIDAGNPRARWIPRIRNLVGYAEGLSGPQLLKRLHRQVKLYPVEFLKAEATIRRNPKGFIVEAGERKIKTRTVILATGLIDAQPPVTNLTELRESSLLGYCPICDGYDHRDHKVALIVKNNQCFKKLRFIRALCPQMVVVPVGNFIFSNRIRKYAATHGLKLALKPLRKMNRDPKTGRLLIYLEDFKKPIRVDFAYVALGTQFNKSAVKHLNNLKRNRDGFILTSSHQQTSIPGLYAVGDCVNALAQVSVAIGQAALAATRIHHDLFFKKN